MRKAKRRGEKNQSIVASYRETMQWSWPAVAVNGWFTQLLHRRNRSFTPQPLIKELNDAWHGHGQIGWTGAFFFFAVIKSIQLPIRQSINRLVIRAGPPWCVGPVGSCLFGAFPALVSLHIDELVDPMKKKFYKK
jgi:hypothetical protein